MANQSKVDDDNDEYPIGDREILRLLDESRLAFEKGDKSALMKCVFRCARFQAVIPEWAADALLVIQDDMEIGSITDFNSAFGRPLEKANTRAARARKEKSKHEVLTVLMRLRAEGCSLNDSEMFSQAQERLQDLGLKVNHRDIQDIYKSDGDFIRTIPRKPPPLQGNYAIANLNFKKPRRRGRNILKD
jgi:hypothetical protein